MKRTIEELLQAPYWIIDILPEQVPADSPGQYFAVEEYYLKEPQFSAVKQKHIDLVLKLNCYRSLFLEEEGEPDPAPEETARRMRVEHLCILLDGSMIVSEPDATYLTVYDPDEELLELIGTITAGEGLYVWRPESEDAL